VVRVRVSVLTPSVPERPRFLRECFRSVEAQTLPEYQRQHLVAIDEAHAGCAVTVNRLAVEAVGEWLFILADDDLMLPGCLEAHLAAAVDADVVYAPPLVWGADATAYRQGHPAIPSASLIRTALWRQLGGYNETLRREEDRDFYERAVEAGARFVRVADEPTWVYRIHPGSKSWAGLERTWVA
jgi:glycosyltransferase involved in cell wall biosynthesis